MGSLASTEMNQLHAELCGALADPHRIGLLYELSAGPQPVTSLVQTLGMPQSSVSRHLRVLRDQRLVVARRQGKMVFYELADPELISALDLLRSVLASRLEAAARLSPAANGLTFN